MVRRAWRLGLPRRLRLRTCILLMVVVLFITTLLRLGAFRTYHLDLYSSVVLPTTIPLIPYNDTHHDESKRSEVQKSRGLIKYISGQYQHPKTLFIAPLSTKADQSKAERSAIMVSNALKRSSNIDEIQTSINRTARVRFCRRVHVHCRKDLDWLLKRGEEIPTNSCRLWFKKCYKKSFEERSHPSNNTTQPTANLQPFDPTTATHEGPSPRTRRDDFNYIPEATLLRKKCNGLLPTDSNYAMCVRKAKGLRLALDISLAVVALATACTIALAIIHLCGRNRRLEQKSKLAAVYTKPMSQVGGNYRLPPVVFSPNGLKHSRKIQWTALPHRTGRPIRDEEQDLEGQRPEKVSRNADMSKSTDGTIDERFFRRIFKRRNSSPPVLPSPVLAHRIPSLQLPTPELSVRLPPPDLPYRRFSSGDISLIGNRRVHNSVVGMTIPEERDSLGQDILGLDGAFDRMDGAFDRIILTNGGKLRPSVPSKAREICRRSNERVSSWGDRRITC